MLPFVGGNFDSLAFSPTLVVYANEIIRQVRQFASGFSLNDELLDLGNIRKIGPGGNYLMAPLTLKSCRDMKHMSEIWPSYTIAKWQEVGQPKAEKLLREKTMDLFTKLSAPDDHDDLMGKGEEFILGI